MTRSNNCFTASARDLPSSTVADSYERTAIAAAISAACSPNSTCVFTKKVGRFLDRVLKIASMTEDRFKAALFRLLAIKVAMLSHPMSDVRKGTAHRLETGEFESITESCLHHYIDSQRLTQPKKLWTVRQAINSGVFQGEGEIRKASILDELPSINADIAYFDPPYPGVMSYERKYILVDEILEGMSRETSPFTAKNGADMIDTLFEKALHIPIWILSLGNAVVTLAELEQKMIRQGRQTRALEIKHQHLGAVATEEKKEKNREYMVMGWDSSHELLRDLEKGEKK